MKLADIRIDYTLKSLDEKDVKPSPIDQFKIWVEEAHQSKVHEWNAMNLSTVRPDGKPNSRIVLLKEVDTGLVFFTNYNSAKGKELENNPFAAITFFWPVLERQVRFIGEVEKIKIEESDAYFFSRPFASQIGALASPQSQVIPNRAFLEEKEAALLKKTDENTIKRPEHWGGYRLVPEEVEFWQGRSSRLHDRIHYQREGEASWKIERLAP
ncbi:pyridoxamine 5'-phosphate oxidase [Aquiflexum gelatinilyticum]|uniref:Pyridoxine/pyridoxamine 5'-phosphate oxidase n=1 Tax=Aquiflexum gelatinilyticum TaxID=2961943 RepID=A0A9X2P745_9BACT|nr:pyridoxamine 5'-phosphate oxidase [Aquiflexum gelatinilyticum]MCR9016627.1 pyridoxamine 5'-phosphate oxidase [Aquiflexum gelatinilyticum]MCS4432769.1 pyridoxamine 5'-phosphate oxidase [Aquiflexum gelatinilyticum]